MITIILTIEETLGEEVSGLINLRVRTSDSKNRRISRTLKEKENNLREISHKRKTIILHANPLQKRSRRERNKFSIRRGQNGIGRVVIVSIKDLMPYCICNYVLVRLFLEVEIRVK